MDNDARTNLQRLKETIIKDHERLGPDDRLGFRCHKDIPCFNQCCRDVNIFLTPYDVLRLKNALGMRSDDFIERHTILPIEKGQKYPVVVLKMEGDAKTCPFVTAQGCGVYKDRPWACRIYPIGEAHPNNEQTGRSFYFKLEEGDCLGHRDPKEQTIREWLHDQEVTRYDDMGALFRAVIFHPGFERIKELEPRQMQQFFLATYDLDRFREFIFESSFLQRFALDPAQVEQLRRDDEALLSFGSTWLRHALCGEPLLEPDPNYVPKSRKKTGKDVQP